MDFVFQFISIAPVVEDLVPNWGFYLSEAGPFDHKNSSSLFQVEFLRFSPRQILGADLVSLACHVDSVHLFQIVIKRAG